ncbi:hypothetical protein [Nonomuraea sp. NPDC050310]|uniref:hypothetical protein n=1 Tax=unclassified Nonomuraea TaxID=2593643 RepID=UPI0033FEDAC2
MRAVLLLTAGGVTAWLGGPPLAALIGFRLPAWHAALLVVAALAVTLLTRGLPRPPETGPVPAGRVRREPSPRTPGGVSTWERRLRAGAKDAARFELTVRDHLRPLVESRLRRHRELTLEHARDVLGTELHTLLTRPVTAVPDEAALARMITRIEEI